MPENREKTGKFAKGHSGNPGGRPRRTQEQRDALESIRLLTNQAAGMLGRILNDETASPAVRLRAVEIILDRAYGKPQQTVEIERPKADMAEEIAAVLAQRQKELSDKEERGIS